MKELINMECYTIKGIENEKWKVKYERLYLKLKKQISILFSIISL